MPVRPDDPHDRQLVDRVAPPDWVQPTPAGRYNLVVLGGGTAGLVAAHGAAGLGARVALVEAGMLGGDCLVSGCVPSKALIASAAAAQAVRTAPELGVRTTAPDVDFAAVMGRMRRIRAGIAHEDSALRLRDAGVDVFLGRGRFTDRDRLVVETAGGPLGLSFARAVIATGAHAVLPPVPGLAEALARGQAVTHEGFFALEQRPERLVVLGAGPIGCELAQAARRLGSEVAVVEPADRLLPGEEPDAGEALQAAFTAEGIALHLGRSATAVDEGGLTLDDGTRLRGDRILVATGRRPRTDGLGLDAAGVAFDGAGITVDDGLCTTNPHVYASGDCASAFRFTHAADALSRVVIA
ncbi:MAG: FAD-dependent oxidoreductase, partial [Alphaproteobacteria bacterium]|nr:FAD-dependent oxidoreductase [Alphaproteobacteria bacterium]